MNLLDASRTLPKTHGGEGLLQSGFLSSNPSGVVCVSITFAKGERHYECNQKSERPDRFADGNRSDAACARYRMRIARRRESSVLRISGRQHHRARKRARIERPRGLDRPRVHSLAVFEQKRRLMT